MTVGFFLSLFLLPGCLAAAPPANAHKHFAAPATAARLPVSPYLISFWPGNGSAQDVISGHDGILSGGVRFAPGRKGKAFAFDGAHDYVRIPFSLSFDFAPADQWTLSLWVQPQSVGKYQALVVKAPVGGEWEWGILLDPQNHFYTGRAAHDIAQSKTTAQVGHWYPVAVTYDNGAWSMYVNGIPEAHADGVYVGQSLGGLAFGHKGEIPATTGDPDWFHGLMMDVMLYNHALDPAQVAKLAQLGRR